MAETRWFEDKVVVVTGAGALGGGMGNGKAAAILYARHGAKVVLVDRRPEALEETRTLIESEGGECSTVVADVSHRDGVRSYIEHAVTQYGGIDVLQNNAGVGPTGSTLDFPDRHYELCFRLNVDALYHAVREVVPIMRERGGGSVVNISSIASLRSVGAPFAAYGASKAAANQLIRAFAVEFAPDNIRFNTVVVGYVDTASVGVAYKASSPEEFEQMRVKRAQSVPLRRSGTPWDVANASLFLSSDLASFTTGTEVLVDGGMANTAAAR